MTKAWGALFILAAVSTAQADEATCAWHFASSPVGRYSLLGEGVPIAEPPSPTVFVEKENRLLDLSAGMREDMGAGQAGWLLWNETRHLLIAHGDARLMTYAAYKSRFDNQPVQGTLDLSWYQGIPFGDPVPTGAEPVHRMEIVGASGSERKSSWKGDSSGMLLNAGYEGKLDCGQTLQAGASINLDWEEKGPRGNLIWSLTQGMIFDTRSKEPKTLAQMTRPGGGTWTITATARDSQIDGTPREASQWREVNGSAVPMEYPAISPPQVPDRITIRGRELKLESRIVLRLQAAIVVGSIQSASVGSEEISWTEPKEWLAEAQVPTELKPFVTGPMLDLKPLSGLMKQQTDEVAFMGWDPCSQVLLVAGPESGSHDPFDEIFACGTNRTVAVTLRSNGSGTGPSSSGLLLGCLNGQKQTLSCRPAGTNQDGAEWPALLDCDVEPHIDDGGKAVDLRYRMHLEADGDQPGSHIEGRITLPPGKESVLQGKGGKTGQASVSIRTDIVPVHQFSR